MTESSFVIAMADGYLLTHRRVLKLVDAMSDAQLAWRATDNSHNCAFHLWHLARWADHLQAALPGMTPVLTHRLGSGHQIWETDALAVRWGLEGEQYGYANTGMGMSDDLARTFVFPSRTELLAYLQKVIDAAERALRELDDEQFAAAELWQPMTDDIWEGGTVGDAILSHLLHANRHLGAIECLLGQQTGSGTASV